MLSGLVIGCLVVGLVLMFQIDRLGDHVMNRERFETHPTHVTSWCDVRGRWHDVPTTRRDGQSREEWMRDAKADLDASIAEFGPAMDPQPQRPEGR